MKGLPGGSGLQGAQREPQKLRKLAGARHFRNLTGSSSAEWGQAWPPAEGCQWGCVTNPGTPASCAHKSFCADEAKWPQSGRGAAPGPAAKAGPALYAAMGEPSQQLTP